MIQAAVWRQLTVTLALNAVGAVVALAVTYAVGFLLASLLAWSWAGWLALIWTAGLAGLGIVQRRRGLVDDGRILECPWEVNSVGAYVARLEYYQIVGVAHVVAEIIHSAPRCILAVIDSWRKRTWIRSCDPVVLRDVLLPYATAAHHGQRFLPAPNVHEHGRVMMILLLTGVLWAKQEHGVTKLGINRAYESLV